MPAMAAEVRAQVEEARAAAGRVAAAVAAPVEVGIMLIAGLVFVAVAKRR